MNNIWTSQDRNWLRNVDWTAAMKTLLDEEKR